MVALNNMKIQYRLWIGFGVLIFIMLAFTVMGVKNASDTNRNAEYIAGNLMEKVIAANNALNAMQQITTDLSIITFSDDIALKDTIKKDIAEKRTFYASELQKIERLEKSDEARSFIKKIQSDTLRGKDANTRLMTLADSGMKSEAARVYMEEATQILSDLGGSTRNLIAYQQKDMKREVGQIVAGNKRFSVLLIALCIAGLVFGTILSVVLTRSITTPIGNNARHMGLLADGDLTLEVKVTRKDEFAAVQGAVGRMIHTWKGIVEKINDVAGNVASASHQLSASAEQTSRGSNNQAQRASQLSTATEEMAQTVMDIAQNANRIAESATDTALMAKRGEEVVDKSVSEVKEIARTVDVSAEFVRLLGSKSEQIGKIVNVIDDIADQTNLLALNAAIEAARAGEQGRGFAVVADEVKKLAERTAKATAEISSMITTIQDEVFNAVNSMETALGKVNIGVELATEAGDALKEIVARVDDLQLMVQQIASATEEMTATSDEINKDIAHIADISNEASASSEQTAQAAGSLMNLSLNLQKVMEHFRV